MARGSVKPVERKGVDGIAYRVWRARVPAGVTADGTRRQLTKNHRTRKEADRWVAEQLGRIARGDSLVHEIATVGQLLDRWLPLHARDVGGATARADAWAAGIIREALDAAPLQNLTVLRLQAFYDGLDGRLAPTSVKVVHRVLRSALDQAVAWELIERNKAPATKRATVPRAKHVVWTAAQADLFLAKTADDFDGPLFALLLSTGMRIGEALALDWRHVDLEVGRLTIERTMTYAGPGQTIVVGTRAKTDSSHRMIVLPLAAQRALRRQRDRQGSRRAECGDGWADVGAVFDRGDGIRRTAGAARHRLRSINAALGLPHLSPHGLRHTVSTLLFRRKVSPKLIQELLGHSSVDITLDTYTHLDDADREEVARSIDGLFPGEIMGQSAEG